MEAETVEQMQARHRREARHLQGRVTSKKKNATKKTRKGVNDECAEMERQMRERQAGELAALAGGGDTQQEEEDEEEGQQQDGDEQDMAARMRALGVNELAAKPPQQPTTTTTTSSSSKPPDGSGAGGAGKKRNRQKERLARRAAEQEAAAEAAAAEAAGMTDRRGRERERMAAEMARQGLVEHEVRPDGHCLFSAVADQLGQAGVPLQPPNTPTTAGEEGTGEAGYKAVRRAAAGYIEARGDEFAGFLEGGEDAGAYAARIRDTAEWGGQLELLAVARVYGVEVCVVQDGRTEVIRPGGGGEGGGEGDGEGGEGRKKIWLAYYRHGYGLGEHYNSLRKKG